jgi:hypothetical protein
MRRILKEWVDNPALAAAERNPEEYRECARVVVDLDPATARSALAPSDVRPRVRFLPREAGEPTAPSDAAAPEGRTAAADARVPGPGEPTATVPEGVPGPAGEPTEAAQDAEDAEDAEEFRGSDSPGEGA